jgi:hypothetical protein
MQYIAFSRMMGSQQIYLFCNVFDHLLPFKPWDLALAITFAKNE